MVVVEVWFDNGGGFDGIIFFVFCIYIFVLIMLLKILYFICFVNLYGGGLVEVIK